MRRERCDFFYLNSVKIFFQNGVFVTHVALMQCFVELFCNELNSPLQFNWFSISLIISLWLKRQIVYTGCWAMSTAMVPGFRWGCQCLVIGKEMIFGASEQRQELSWRG